MSSMFHHPSWQMSQEWCAGGKPIEGDDDKSLVTSTLLECVCVGGGGGVRILSLSAFSVPSPVVTSKLTSGSSPGVSSTNQSDRCLMSHLPANSLSASFSLVAPKCTEYHSRSSEFAQWILGISRAGRPWKRLITIIIIVRNILWYKSLVFVHKHTIPSLTSQCCRCSHLCLSSSSSQA